MVIHRPTSPSLRLALPRSGGDRLSGPLGRRLDDRFHYLRRVLAGGREPIEAVVVGPGGTWALTLRVEAGHYQKRNGHWYRLSDATESWVPWDADQISAARLAGRPRPSAEDWRHGPHTLQHLGVRHNQEPGLFESHIGMFPPRVELG